MKKLLFSRHNGMCCLLALLLLTLSLSPAQGTDTEIPKSPQVKDLEGPRSVDARILIHAAYLLENKHLLKEQAFDNTIASRGMNRFFDSLDPWKIYFYQSDIDEFKKFEKELDDRAKKGDLAFAYVVFKTYLVRLDERLKMANKILDTPLDFTKDETFVRDPDLIKSWPKTQAEAYDRWRKRVKLDLLVLKSADELEGKEAIEKLRRRYRSFTNRMKQTDADELLEIYVTSFAHAFDPHSSYMSPTTWINFQIDMGKKLQGIGASLQSEDGYTVTRRIIKGGAAAKDGRLKIDDKIVGVGQGKDGEIVDIVDMKLNDVVRLIRGEAGTIVRLQVQPAAGGKNKIYNITREEIELTESEAKGKIFPVISGGKKYKIGVIELPSFYMDMEAAMRGDIKYKSTTRDVRKIILDFKIERVDAILLDLRYNGGGALTEAINLTGLFIDEGPVVQVKLRNDMTQTHRDRDPGALWSGPLVVAISKFSASASEILAGAIQDYGRGLIVGDKATHGKGSVQSLHDISKGIFGASFRAREMGRMKLTEQQFYRPSGDSTQLRGVLSDIELPSVTSHLDVAEGDLDYPVKFDRIARQRYPNMGKVTDQWNDILAKNSEERRKKDEDFQKVEKRIKQYLEQKTKKEITLNEKKYLAERKELDLDKEQEEEMKKIMDQQEGIRQDFYLDELMAITADYARLLGGGKAVRVQRRAPMPQTRVSVPSERMQWEYWQRYNKNIHNRYRNA